MTTPSLRLDELALELPGRASVRGDGGVRVSGVRHDSRTIEPGDLFVVRRGQTSDGAAFLAQALGRGAVAVLAADEGIGARTEGRPVLLVDDVMLALPHAAAAVHGHPDRELELVGVTGTNGKTTVTHLLRAAIDGARGCPSCGVVGTVAHAFADLRVDAAHTTPEGDELARLLRAMRDRGATHVAMEVSSIALEARRPRALRFRVAAFTNLTQDHLDFHHTMAAYAAAKERLFAEYEPARAVINIDSAFGDELAGRVRAPLLRTSTRSDARADVQPVRVELDERGIRGTVRTPSGVTDITSPLVGAHNLENLVVVLGVLAALELDVRAGAAALATVTGAPGRLERCSTDDDDVAVLVDYAHTPDALARVLDSVRAVGRGRVTCVFGCGGDRDRSKRPLMGRAALRAHRVIITNDNPRTEDPVAIARAIEEAVSETSRSYDVILDRRAAIARAIDDASPGDVVLVAGKGHEPYQIVGTERLPFDDRDEAREALRRRRESRARGR